MMSTAREESGLSLAVRRAPRGNEAGRMLSLSDCTQSNCSNPTPWITIFIIIIVVVVIVGLVVGARNRRNKP
jgi:hypothetical protein